MNFHSGKLGYSNYSLSRIEAMDVVRMPYRASIQLVIFIIAILGGAEGRGGQLDLY